MGLRSQIKIGEGNGRSLNNQASDARWSCGQLIESAATAVQLTLLDTCIPKDALVAGSTLRTVPTGRSGRLDTV